MQTKILFILILSLFGIESCSRTKGGGAGTGEPPSENGASDTNSMIEDSEHEVSEDSSLGDTSETTNPPLRENRWIALVGGTFTQGTSDPPTIDYDWFPSPTPAHDVTVHDFFIQESEVTIGQYLQCVNAGECTPIDSVSTRCAAENWSGAPERGNHPVDCVSFPQAVAYCEWIGGRLPSESEWEYAVCSAGQTARFPWGDEPVSCEYAVMDEGGGSGCGTNDTRPVCSITKGNTRQGLCDMLGNVSEMVADIYHHTYENAPTDGSPWMEKGGSSGIARGASYQESAVYLNTKFRAPGPVPSVIRGGIQRIGFRCAK